MASAGIERVLPREGGQRSLATPPCGKRRGGGEIPFMQRRLKIDTETPPLHHQPSPAQPPVPGTSWAKLAAQSLCDTCAVWVAGTTSKHQPPVAVSGHGGGLALPLPLPGVCFSAQQLSGSAERIYRWGLTCRPSQHLVGVCTCDPGKERKFSTEAALAESRQQSHGSHGCPGA